MQLEPNLKNVFRSSIFVTFFTQKKKKMKKNKINHREYLLADKLSNNTIYLITFTLFVTSFMLSRYFFLPYFFKYKRFNVSKLKKNNVASISMNSDCFGAHPKAVFIWLNQTIFTSYNGILNISIKRTEITPHESIEHDIESTLGYSPSEHFPTDLFPTFFDFGDHQLKADVNISWSLKREAEFEVGLRAILYRSYWLSRFANIFVTCLTVAAIFVAFSSVKFLDWLIVFRVLIPILALVSRCGIYTAYPIFVRMMRYYSYLLIHLSIFNTNKPSYSFLVFVSLINVFELHFALDDADAGDYFYTYTFDLYDFAFYFYMLVYSLVLYNAESNAKVLMFLFLFCFSDAVCSVMHGFRYLRAYDKQTTPILDENIAALHTLQAALLCILTSPISEPKHSFGDELELLGQDQ